MTDEGNGIGKPIDRRSLMMLMAATGASATFGPGFGALALPRLADSPEISIEILASDEPPGGVTELGVPTVAPAVANAVYHATGRRIRDLPIRIEKLLV